MKKLIKEKGAPGQSPKGFIPLSVPEISGNEWRYVKDCLDTGWVSSVGSYVDQFESAVAKYVGCKYAVACTSGTAALHIALLVAGVKPNEEVIMPTLTFGAPAFAIRYVGAWPVFMDADPVYWQLDVVKLKEFLSKDCQRVGGKVINRHTKRVVRAIVPVHILGHSVDMAPLLKLAKEYGLYVIEDGAESLGAEYKGKKVGSFGHLNCFSFNGNKVITCGGGGMIVTNNQKWAERARHLTTQAKSNPIEYLHDEIGYNYRLTNIQAAVGLAQLEKLDGFLKRKKNIAKRYAKKLAGIKGISCPKEAPWAENIWWLYTVLINKKDFGQDSRAVMKELAKEGIHARPLWHPLHSQKIFKGCYAHRIETADKLYEQALSLPTSVGLNEKDQGKVIAAVVRLKKGKA